MFYVIDWQAISAVTTLLAVIVALGLPFLRDYLGNRKEAKSIRLRTSLPLILIKETIDNCLDSKGDNEFLKEVIDYNYDRVKLYIDELKINSYAYQKLPFSEQEILIKILLLLETLAFFVDIQSRFAVFKRLSPLIDNILKIYKKRDVKSIIQVELKR